MEEEEIRAKAEQRIREEEAARMKRDEDDLQREGWSLNPFEENVVAQPVEISRSARINSTRPSPSEVVPHQPLVNTNPFLDNCDWENLVSSERTAKKGRAPLPPQKKSEPGSYLLSRTEETKQSKRPAPQPPEGPSKNLTSTGNQEQVDTNPDIAKNKNGPEDGSSNPPFFHHEEETSTKIFPPSQRNEHKALPLRTEEPLEKVGPQPVDQQLSRSHKKSRAPLPPSNQSSKRFHQSNPSSSNQQPSHPTPEVQSKLKKDQHDDEESQMKKPQAPVLVDECSSSGFRSLRVNEVPDDGGDVRAQVAPALVIRQQTVKPLSPAEPEQAEPRSSKTTELRAKQAAGAAPDSPYAELTEAELVSMARRQQQQLRLRDARIEELERYIDQLVLRVMEENPSILMSMRSRST